MNQWAAQPSNSVASERADIQLSNVTFRYGKRVAVSEVSLEVADGQLFAVLGPNGGGKTTLFRILCTLLLPEEGTVRVSGLDVEKNAQQIRRLIGVVFQSNSLDPHLSAEENLVNQGHLFGMRGGELKAQTKQLLDRFGLDGRKRDLIRTLSGGLRRRVELAKSLLHRPRILILDEPTAGLDPKVRHEFWQYVQELRQDQGITVVFTSHLMEEAERCDELVALNAGRIVARGSPAVLKQRIQGDVVIVKTPDAEQLGKSIGERFNSPYRIVNDTLRMELPRGHEFVQELMEAYPDQIESVTIGRPTLEDAFVHETGQMFSDSPDNS